MKIRLSNKDLLLLIGILVAVIIAFTTLVYRESGAKKQTSVTPHSSMTFPNLIIVKRLIREAI